MQSVLLFHDPPHRLPLEPELADLGYTIVAELDDPRTLQAEVTRLEPGVIVVTTRTPSEALFGALSAVAESSPRPVVMFALDANREVIRRAVDHGVGAYVVEGWARERLTPIIEAATARFEAYESMRQELASTRLKLSERKLIEKAKGIVMEQRKLTEAQAYGALRKMAMDQNLALAEVARRVISVAELLG